MSQRKRKQSAERIPGLGKATRVGDRNDAPGRATANTSSQRNTQQADGTAIPQVTWSDGLASFFTRDGVENILIAILLALLFRAFEAEAFVIPTGSMAPTLMGRHKDVRCDQCRYRIQAGDTPSRELADGRVYMSPTVTHVICPMCGFPTEVDGRQRHRPSYTGDRILVSKFAYQYADPERWDVIVFKFPGNRKQNYIKRLVGLPNETIRVHNGDVFVGQPDGTWEIARKTPEKIPYLLQLVDDTKHLSPRLREVGWPDRWSDPERDRNPSSENPDGWTRSDDHHTFEIVGNQNEMQWLRYRQVVPWDADWRQLQKNAPPDLAQRVRPSLITDFYAYNVASAGGSHPPMGYHWVGDLAVEADVQIRSDSGTLALDLVEGGHHYRCEIDVHTGRAVLSINGGQEPFTTVAGRSSAPTELIADTPIQRRGPYRIRFANLDDQLNLWVDGQHITFHAGDTPHPASYPHRDDVRPQWSVDDPGDLRPVGIGARKVDLSVHRLRVYRDIYYTAPSGSNPMFEYDSTVNEREVVETFYRPETWADSRVFDARGELKFQMGPDEFFPMGDNSPCSQDARLWSDHVTKPPQYDPLVVKPFVHRDLLIGKAFAVYWPHGWELGPIPVKIVPNVNRMKWIR